MTPCFLLLDIETRETYGPFATTEDAQRSIALFHPDTKLLIVPMQLEETEGSGTKLNVVMELYATVIPAAEGV